jgi:hypothetical protein
MLDRNDGYFQGDGRYGTLTVKPLRPALPSQE